MFALTSDITIGNFRFTGVHDVQIKRSLHSYTDTAVIKLPAKGLIKKKGKTDPTVCVVGKKFTDGDPVTIKLGYNDQLIEEFRGFVTSRDLNIPLKITCEGYSWQLKRNSVSGSWGSIAVKDLLQKAIANTTIKSVICATDLLLQNMHFEDGTGATVIDAIIKETDDNLAIFFIAPDVPWCGTIYTPYADGKDVFGQGKVKFRIGYNVPRDNSLKQRLPQDDPGTHIYVKKTSTGTQLKGQSEETKNAICKYKKTLNSITNEHTLAILAQEHQYRENYEGYEGDISAFLQPYCKPGYQAWVADDDFAGRAGWYLVESTEVTFGSGGARRKVFVGALLGFNKKAAQ